MHIHTYTYVYIHIHTYTYIYWLQVGLGGPETLYSCKLNLKGGWGARAAGGPCAALAPIASDIRACVHLRTSSSRTCTQSARAESQLADLSQAPSQPDSSNQSDQLDRVEADSLSSRRFSLRPRRFKFRRRVKFTQPSAGPAVDNWAALAVSLPVSQNAVGKGPPLSKILIGTGYDGLSVKRAGRQRSGK